MTDSFNSPPVRQNSMDSNLAYLTTQTLMKLNGMSFATPSAGFSVSEIADRLGDTVDTVYKTSALLLQSRKTEMIDLYDKLY